MNILSQSVTKLSLTFGLLQILTIHICGSAPTDKPERWTSPCSSSMAAVPGRISNINIPITKFLENIQEKAIYVMAKSEDIQKAYVPPKGSRITSKILAQHLSNMWFPGFPTGMNEEQSGNITDVLLQDYTAVSAIAIMWSEMVKDESGDMQKNMKVIEDKLYSVLCDMDTALRGSIEKYVRHDDVITSRFVTSNRQYRNMRDFVVVGNTMKFFSHLKEKYELMDSELKILAQFEKSMMS